MENRLEEYEITNSIETYEITIKLLKEELSTLEREFANRDAERLKWKSEVERVKAIHDKVEKTVSELDLKISKIKGTIKGIRSVIEYTKRNDL